jgi:hypothetical protein
MGGKSSPPPPDYSGMERIAEKQLEFAERQYDENKPLLTGLATAMTEAQRQQMEQAKDYYDYQKETFRPLEVGLVADAEKFNTAAYQEEMAGKAAADAAAAFQSAQGASMRSATRRGVNPNSGAFGAASNANAMGLAAMTAGARTGARSQAEQLGYARKLDAVGLGRNLAGASVAAYQGATQAGTGAGAQYRAAGQDYQQGLSNAGQSYGTILNSQTSMYNSAQDNGLDVGGLMQGAAAMSKAGMFGVSDRRLKMNIKEVGRDERTMLPLYEFEYIGKPGTTYLGVMSDDVRKKFPEMVIVMPNGYDAVNYAGLGIEMIEVEPCA